MFWRDVIYDIETYPNCFTIAIYDITSGNAWLYEISDERNDIEELMQLLVYFSQNKYRMVGYNNDYFDYTVIHEIMEHYGRIVITAEWIYRIAMELIRNIRNKIWANKHHIPQVDLFKIHHFDNEARRTSLKTLEFNMRMDDIRDLPFDVGINLDSEQKGVLRSYNWHDIRATHWFYNYSLEQIAFRDKLTAQYNRDFTNHNDTKIGKDYFIMELERHGIPCYTRDSFNKKIPRQTQRDKINLAECVFPYVQFEQPEFQRIQQYFMSKAIRETKGVFVDLIATVNDFKYKFGAGGIHGSVESQTVYSDDEYAIFDWDVASYYPNLAIANRLYPEHLSEKFCEIYLDVYNQRKQHKKGTVENAMLKLALNGVYGDSNNRYSPFYDPKYTMSITINGQLLLCMLAEQLIKIPNLTMIQINTDGLTVKLPRVYIQQMRDICKWWEQRTLLELEDVEYKCMFIRDVTNYIGLYTDGKVKRKGAYAHEWRPEMKKERDLQWHQDMSALVVPKAVEAVLVHGQDLRTFLYNHEDTMDFMLRAKVGRKDLLMHGDDEVQKISRYFIGHGGKQLMKVSPPIQGAKEGQWKRKNGLKDDYYYSVIRELKAREKTAQDHLDTIGIPWDERINTKNKSTYLIRRQEICKGWGAVLANDAKTIDRNLINYEFYVAEAMKLIDPVRN